MNVFFLVPPNTWGTILWLASFGRPSSLAQNESPIVATPLFNAVLTTPHQCLCSTYSRTLAWVRSLENRTQPNHLGGCIFVDAPKRREFGLNQAKFSRTMQNKPDPILVARGEPHQNEPGFGCETTFGGPNQQWRALAEARIGHAGPPVGG